MLDSHHRARVYRGTVQICEPNELKAFLTKEKINLIAFEERLHELPPPWGPFIRELRAFVSRDPDFFLSRKCSVLYGQPGTEEVVLIMMYARRAPSGLFPDGDAVNSTDR
jgi:hypothetical protein